MGMVGEGCSALADAPAGSAQNSRGQQAGLQRDLCCRLHNKGEEEALTGRFPLKLRWLEIPLCGFSKWVSLLCWGDLSHGLGLPSTLPVI